MSISKLKLPNIFRDPFYYFCRIVFNLENSLVKQESHILVADCIQEILEISVGVLLNLLSTLVFSV